MCYKKNQIQQRDEQDIKKPETRYRSLMGHFQHSLIDSIHRDLLRSNSVPGTVLTKNKGDKFFSLVCRQPINKYMWDSSKHYEEK